MIQMTDEAFVKRVRSYNSSGRDHSFWERIGARDGRWSSLAFYIIVLHIGGLGFERPISFPLLSHWERGFVEAIGSPKFNFGESARHGHELLPLVT